MEISGDTIETIGDSVEMPWIYSGDTLEAQMTNKGQSPNVQMPELPR
jgi:hypothetical protein